MRERERMIISALTTLFLLLWLGFLLHKDPRFAGSLMGSLLAIIGTTLMLVPLFYMMIKRIGPLKQFSKRFISMRTALAIHIYAGIIGPILVILHTGHKFDSALGIVLTAMTLVVVISGFVGRYLMRQFNEEIREKRQMRDQLSAALDTTAAALRQRAGEAKSISRLARRVRAWFLEPDIGFDADRMVRREASEVAASLADVEYALATHGLCKRWFARWLKVHIGISFLLYLLLGIHIWSVTYFGLRWWS